MTSTVRRSFMNKIIIRRTSRVLGVNTKLGSKRYPTECIKAQTNLERKAKDELWLSHMECGLQDEHCTEGELTKSPCTDVSVEWGLSLGIRHSPGKNG